MDLISLRNNFESVHFGDRFLNLKMFERIVVNVLFDRMVYDAAIRLVL